MLWRLTATAGPVCQILMCHSGRRYPQHENVSERFGWSTHDWRGLDERRKLGMGAKSEKGSFTVRRPPTALAS